jgi:hypothetical protein
MKKGMWYLIFLILITITLTQGINALTTITNCTELQAMENNLTEDYVLGNNIDCSGTNKWNAGEGFIPVGTQAIKFKGSFDGQGYDITDLYINKSGENCGLFGFIYSSATSNEVIRDVGFLNANIYCGGNNAGILAGKIEYRNLIEDISATGTVEGNQGEVGGLIGNLGVGEKEEKILDNSSFDGSVSGIDNVGGLVGYTREVEINNSYAMGSVSGRNYIGGLVGTADMHINNSFSKANVIGTLNYVGGLVGVLWFDVNISNSYAEGKIDGKDFVGGLVGGYYGGRIDKSSAAGNVTGCNYIGGLVGEDWNNEITSSSSTGDVKSECSDYVGGLIGMHSDSHIKDVWTSGRVEGTNYIGGLIGQNGAGTITTNAYFIEKRMGTMSGQRFIENIIESNSGIIENAYSIGKVIGTDNTGGLIGENSEICTNIFWDIETSEQNSSACGTGKTTSEMQDESTYTGWDFDNIWLLPSSGYPCLRWQDDCEDSEDSDGDGILDKEDKCPDTPLSEEQEVYGCSCNQILDLKPGKGKDMIIEKGKECPKGIVNVFERGVGWARVLNLNSFRLNFFLSYSIYEFFYYRNSQRSQAHTASAIRNFSIS